MKNKENAIILRWLLGSVVLCIFCAMQGFPAKAKDVNKVTPVVNIPVKVVNKVVKQTPLVTTSMSVAKLDPIRQEIKNDFGQYYDKAILLLTSPKCAENRSLNPHAVNDNRPWGGVGRDRGIFQINDEMHPLSDEEAFNYKDNIFYAWRMFKNDGFTFSKRWTCGTELKNLGYDI